MTTLNDLTYTNEQIWDFTFHIQGLHKLTLDPSGQLYASNYYVIKTVSVESDLLHNDYSDYVGSLETGTTYYVAWNFIGNPIKAIDISGQKKKIGNVDNNKF